MAAIPVIRTSTTLNPPVRVVTGARDDTRVNWLAATVAFLGLTYCFFSAGSLAGSVLAEKARQEGLSSMARAKAAQAEEGLLSARLDELKSLKAIDAWAVRNGFVASDRVLAASFTQSREQ